MFTVVRMFTAVGLAIALGATGAAPAGQGAPAPGRPVSVPSFRVDPSWPALPNGWVLGEVSSVATDALDHVWLLHRPSRVPVEQRSKAAPPVLELDGNGKLIQAWGGKAAGYEWPEIEHGIFVDHNGFVWIGGNGGPDDQILKFSRKGEFILQIGRSGQSRGNADTVNLHQPADVFVEPRTNELFVADGYGNRRIVVFDAATGAFKRMWGAFANVPTGPMPPLQRDGPSPSTAPVTSLEEGRGSAQFNLVHSVRVSNDGLVYVADRANRRVQIFTASGRFVTQVFVSRDCVAPQCGNGHTAASVAFSHDPEQRFLYVADRSRGRIRILERSTLGEVSAFGAVGAGPGEFNVLHHIATDSKGNLYTAEVNSGRRAQKFVFTGYSTP